MDRSPGKLPRVPDWTDGAGDAVGASQLVSLLCTAGTVDGRGNGGAAWLVASRLQSGLVAHTKLRRGALSAAKRQRRVPRGATVGITGAGACKTS